MSRKKKKILIVDDEPQVIQMLSDLLVSWGYEVRGAQSAHEALDTFSGNDFNLVIADIRMPEMDGFEFMQKLRELDPQCPFIFLTGDASEETAAKTLEAGADDYLVKPVNSSEFRIRIERCLKHHTHIKRLPVLRGVNRGADYFYPFVADFGVSHCKICNKMSKRTKNMGEQSDLQEQEVTTPDFGFAGEISTASMVRVLVKKGIVTSSELLDEERDRRDSILSSVKMRERGSHEHETATRFPRLKRWASKKRWRRRITGILMGWKWKKIRHHKKTETSHSDQEQI